MPPRTKPAAAPPLQRLLAWATQADRFTTLVLGGLVAAITATFAFAQDVARVAETPERMDRAEAAVDSLRELRGAVASLRATQDSTLRAVSSMARVQSFQACRQEGYSRAACRFTQPDLDLFNPPPSPSPERAP